MFVYTCENFRDIFVFIHFILINSIYKTWSNINKVWIRTVNFFSINILGGVADLTRDPYRFIIILLQFFSCVEFKFFICCLVTSWVNNFTQIGNMYGRFDVNIFRSPRPMRFLNRWFEKGKFYEIWYNTSNGSYWKYGIITIIIEGNLYWCYSL